MPGWSVEWIAPEWTRLWLGWYNLITLQVLFPPHPPQYNTSTNLWTWYDYADFIEKKGDARPILFMQSASTIGVGTSLALADYFDYHVLADNNFQVHNEYLEDELQMCKKSSQSKDPSIIFSISS